MEHFSRKRKASQSSPVQEHRCVPQDDDTTSPAAAAAAVVDITGGDAAAHRPKRPRLSLDSTPDPLASPSPPPPPPRKHELGPQSMHHEVCQYWVQRPVSISSPLDSPPPRRSVIRRSHDRYVPPIFPPITRLTLRELELVAILQNPQLRHDLLFDPGLQFRPTPSRRKQLAAERYWVAITREIIHGCTCTSWGSTGTMFPCGCLNSTAQPATTPPSHWGVKVKPVRPPGTPPPWAEDHYHEAYHKAWEDADDCDFSSSSTTSTDEPPPPNPPSRLVPMLTELVEVIRSIVGTSCVVPLPPQPQMHAGMCSARPLPSFASDAEHVLSQFDPELIEQELRRGLFDPSGLFALIGETLKRHCAPMRDRQVDVMINIANGSEETDPTERAVRTFRMCFEILELMKLDIANHQLQHLRSFLTATTPDVELQVFVRHCRYGSTSPHATRVWLQSAWDRACMIYPVGPINVKEETEAGAAPSQHSILLSLRKKVYLSLIEGVTSLVFNPILPVHFTCTTAEFGFPETLDLDVSRVMVLSADAADLTALYMLLMLWRQLVFWKPGSENENNQNGNVNDADVFPPYTRDIPRLEDWEVDRMKREIWEVGPRRIGSCFWLLNGKEDAEEHAKWKNAMQNVALQIAMRAEEARTRTSSAESTPPLQSSPPTGMMPSPDATIIPPHPQPQSSVSSSPTPAPAVPSPMRRPPSQRALALTHGWLESNMRRDSVLARRFRSLLWQEVARVVARMTFLGVRGGVNGVGGVSGGGSVVGVPVPGGFGVKIADAAARAAAETQAEARAYAQATAAAQARARPEDVAASVARAKAQRVAHVVQAYAAARAHADAQTPIRVRASPRAQTAAGSATTQPFIPTSGGGPAAGLEPLMPEIRHLAQRIAKLVLVNMQVYWSLYETEGFLIDEDDETVAEEDGNS